MLTLTEEILRVQGRAEGWTPRQILEWGFDRYGQEVAMASGFGAEGVALIHMASEVRKDFRVFTLDTDFLFPQTHALMEQIERRYGITVERTRPGLTPPEQAERHGEALWSRDPNLCCQLRKVEPLKGKLAGLSAWITAIRREQTAARANARKIEWDAQWGLTKLNPIADWNSEQVWDFIRRHQVPYNPLHDFNYPSIGCTHCTRPVLPGEPARAGRWAGFTKTECGLHARE